MNKTLISSAFDFSVPVSIVLNLPLWIRVIIAIIVIWLIFYILGKIPRAIMGQYEKYN
jgi:hypothetical protein